MSSEPTCHCWACWARRVRRRRRLKRNRERQVEAQYADRPHGPDADPALTLLTDDALAHAAYEAWKLRVIGELEGSLTRGPNGGTMVDQHYRDLRAVQVIFLQLDCVVTDQARLILVRHLHQVFDSLQPTQRVTADLPHT